MHHTFSKGYSLHTFGTFAPETPGKRAVTERTPSARKIKGQSEPDRGMCVVRM